MNNLFAYKGMYPRLFEDEEGAATPVTSGVYPSSGDNSSATSMSGEQRVITMLPMTTTFGAVSFPVTITKEGRIQYNVDTLKKDERFLQHQLALIQEALGKIEEAKRTGNPLEAILVQVPEGSEKVTQEDRRQSMPETSLEMAAAAFRLLQLRNGGNLWRIQEERPQQSNRSVRKESFSVIETEALRSEIGKETHYCVCQYCGLNMKAGGDMKRCSLLDDAVLSRSEKLGEEEDKQIQEKRPLSRKRLLKKRNLMKSKESQTIDEYTSIYTNLNESAETSSSEGAVNLDESTSTASPEVITLDCEDEQKKTILQVKKKPKGPKRENHIKKPLNAFMLFMKETRASVKEESGVVGSTLINQIVATKWNELANDKKFKYYALAKEVKILHKQKFPDYVTPGGKRFKKRVVGEHEENNRQSEGVTIKEANSWYKCRARFGLENQSQWCKNCRRKKKCLRYMEKNDLVKSKQGKSPSDSELSQPSVLQKVVVSVNKESEECQEDKENSAPPMEILGL